MAQELDVKYMAQELDVKYMAQVSCQGGLVPGAGYRGPRHLSRHHKGVPSSDPPPQQTRQGVHYLSREFFQNGQKIFGSTYAV